MTNELTIAHESGHAPLALRKVSAKETKDRILEIRKIASDSDIMKEGIEYYYAHVLTGKKLEQGEEPVKVLSQAGASVLAQALQITVEHSNKIIHVPSESYIVQSRATLKTYAGQILNSSEAICSAREKKFLSRVAELKNTWKPLPKNYWNMDPEDAQSAIGGPGFVRFKAMSQWFIHQVVEGEFCFDEVMHPVMLAAQKRAFVWTVRLLAALSGQFTQDIEENKRADEEGEKKGDKKEPIVNGSGLTASQLSELRDIKESKEKLDTYIVYLISLLKPTDKQLYDAYVGFRRSKRRLASYMMRESRRTKVMPDFKRRREGKKNAAEKRAAKKEKPTKKATQPEKAPEEIKGIENMTSQEIYADYEAKIKAGGKKYAHLKRVMSLITTAGKAPEEHDRDAADLYQACIDAKWRVSDIEKKAEEILKGVVNSAKEDTAIMMAAKDGGAK